jgi:manganese/zinc/iron transport system permease protein
MGSFFAFYALAFAKERGLVFRYLRIYAYHARCLKENALKLLWKKGTMSRSQVCFFLGISRLRGAFVLRRLMQQGWARLDQDGYCLTTDGTQKAASIVRLHRLWELYLTSMLKLETGKVHKTAEEMEHILTPEIEKKLTELLANPKSDPHAQPIPEPVGVYK